MKAVSSQLIDERDRKLTATELNTCPPTSISTPSKSPIQTKSPRIKFLKQDSTEPHSTSPRQPASNRPGAVSMFVSVQEPASLKDWTSSQIKGSGYEKFKSPALFWEIRLKESQISSEKASRPTALQIVALCEVLSEYAERATANGDLLFNSVKEQICSAIFADYSIKDPADYTSYSEMLRQCVPYIIIAERLHADKVALEQKVETLEKVALQPTKRSFTSSGVQTDEAELDVNSGAIALQRKILDLMYQVEEYETENFNSLLERQELDSKTGHMVETQREQIVRLTELSTGMRKQCEVEKECSELYRHQVLKLQAENRLLSAETKAMAKEQISLRFSYDKKLAFVGETLKAERQRFTRERADWLESFVSERYDLFNSMLPEQANEDDDLNEGADPDDSQFVGLRRTSTLGLLNRNSSKHIGRNSTVSNSGNESQNEKADNDHRLRRVSSIVPADKQRSSINVDQASGRLQRNSSIVKRNSMISEEDGDAMAEDDGSQLRNSCRVAGENLRLDLWNRLTDLGKSSAAQLDALYTDKGKLENDRDHRQCIRDILKSQELTMQQLLLTSPALQGWKFVASDQIP